LENVIFGNEFYYPFDLRQWILLSLWSSAMDFAIPLIFGNGFCYPFDLRQWILLSLWSSAMDFAIPLIFGKGFCYPLIFLLTVFFKVFPIASTVYNKIDIYIVIAKCQYETYALCHLNIIGINYICFALLVICIMTPSTIWTLNRLENDQYKDVW
jgi:hypothetical protein